MKNPIANRQRKLAGCPFYVCALSRSVEQLGFKYTESLLSSIASRAQAITVTAKGMK